MSQDETMLGKGVLSRRDCVKLMGGFAIAMGTVAACWLPIMGNPQRLGVSSD